MKKNVAIFPAGTEIGLEIHRALSYSIHFNVYGFSSISDHAKFVYKNYDESLPYYNSEVFLTILNELIKKYEIEYLYPAHDDVQIFLTENTSKLQAKLITSDLNTVRICRSKLLTYSHFRDTKFVPEVFNRDNLPSKYPVFAKPDVGQGSKGVKKIINRSSLEEIFKLDQKMAIVEYLPGEEYTIDCFTNYKGELLTINIRNRNRIKTGISVNSKTQPLPEEVVNIAHLINEKLHLNGGWFFQLKKDKHSRYKLLEIAPRISGTMGVNRNKGINFPLLSLFNYEKIDVSIIDNNYSLEVDRALVSRYHLDINFDTVYVDLDDTIIVNQQVNTVLMQFLYQSLNKGIDIVLISKHAKDIENTLLDFKINKNLFTRIIHLHPNDDKANYIEERNAIFIDDSFAERINVSKKQRIPVFDCSEIESLIDWKK